MARVREKRLRMESGSGQSLNRSSVSSSELAARRRVVGRRGAAVQAIESRYKWPNVSTLVTLPWTLKATLGLCADCGSNMLCLQSGLIS